MTESMNLPIGFKFMPSDDELLEYYLLNKICGAPFMFEEIVPEIDLYSEKEAWDIWDEYGGGKLEKGEALYFFTKLKSVNGGKGSRMVRTVGSAGTWKEDSGSEVKNKNNVVIGFLRRYSYKNPKRSHQNGAWSMQEFRLNPSLLTNSRSTTAYAGCKNHMNDGEYVICRIRKNHRKRNWACNEDEDDVTAPPQPHMKKIDTKSDRHLPIAEPHPQPQPQPFYIDPNYTLSTATYDQQQNQDHQTSITSAGLNNNGNYIIPESQPDWSWIADPATMASSVASLQHDQHLQPPNHHNNLAQFNEDMMMRMDWSRPWQSTSHIDPVDVQGHYCYHATNIDEQNEQTIVTTRNYGGVNNVTNIGSTEEPEKLLTSTTEFEYPMISCNSNGNCISEFDQLAVDWVAWADSNFGSADDWAELHQLLGDNVDDLNDVHMISTSDDDTTQQEGFPSL